MPGSRQVTGAVGWRAYLALLLTWLLLSAPGWLVLPHPYSLQHATLHSQYSRANRLCLDTTDGLQFSSLLPSAHLGPAAPRFADLPLVSDLRPAYHSEFSQYNRPPPLV